MSWLICYDAHYIILGGNNLSTKDFLFLHFSRFFCFEFACIKRRSSVCNIISFMFCSTERFFSYGHVLYLYDIYICSCETSVIIWPGGMPWIKNPGGWFINCVYLRGRSLLLLYAHIQNIYVYIYTRIHATGRWLVSTWAPCYVYTNVHIPIYYIIKII